MEAEAQKLRHCERRTAVWGWVTHLSLSQRTVQSSMDVCGGPSSLPPPTGCSWRCALFNGSPGMTVSSGSVGDTHRSNALAVHDEWDS